VRKGKHTHDFAYARKTKAIILDTIKITKNGIASNRANIKYVCKSFLRNSMVEKALSP
jgi:hypothetical protein